MKRILFPVLAVCLLASCSKEPVPQDEETPEVKTELLSAKDTGAFVPGVTIVKFSDDMIDLIEGDLSAGHVATRSMGLNQALDELGIKSIKRLFPDAGEFEPRTRKEGLHKWYVVTYDEAVTQTRAAVELGSIPGVEYTEPRQKVRMLAFDDPSLPDQWGFGNTSLKGADINVQYAWDNYTTGDPSVIVSVVDAGIDMTHPDLEWNCSPDRSWNFVDDNRNIVAGSHGTHVAGTIAAVNNNGTGVCGTAGGDYALGKRGVTLISSMIFKTVTSDGETSTLSGNTSYALKWGADHGAVICQNSWGYDYDANHDGKLTGDEVTRAMAAQPSASDAAGIEYFIKYAGCDNQGNQLPDSPMKGGVVIFSAGNDAIQNGAPANHKDVIAVGAITKNGTRATFSCYGDYVSLCAPGVNILSTVPGATYSNMNGTSMACPHVSGVAALLVSYFGGPGFTNEMLKEKLLEGANRKLITPSFKLGGLVDVLGSLVYQNDVAPAAVTDLSGTPRSNFVDLSWTVPADGNNRPAYGFTVVYSTDKAAVDAADPAGKSLSGVKTLEVTPNLPVGKEASATLSGLDFESDYYFKVVAHSYSPLYAEPSATIKVTTLKNNPPVITASPSGKVTLKAFQTAKVSFTFSEPDTHDFTVTYEGASEADSYTTKSKTSGEATIVGVKADAGTYTARLTATDRYGESSVYDLVYTILENNPPQATKGIDNKLFTSIGEEFSINLGDYFTDPDGEPLTYEFTYSDNSVAYLNLSASQIIGTTLKYGLTSVTITAKDAKGDSASIDFMLLVRDPKQAYSAYPNPVVKNLYIATGQNLEPAQVRVASETGAVVFDDTVQASAFVPASVDMSACAPGKYHLTLKFGSKEYTQIIVKK